MQPGSSSRRHSLELGKQFGARLHIGFRPGLRGCGLTSVHPPARARKPDGRLTINPTSPSEQPACRRASRTHVLSLYPSTQFDYRTRESSIFREFRGNRGSEKLAGRQGLEPRFTGPEPVVLPLNDLPVVRERAGDYSRCPARTQRPHPDPLPEGEGVVFAKIASIAEAT